jgi:hypothetical protein
VIRSNRLHQFINTLHEHPQCSGFLHDMLKLIQEDMLLVDEDQRLCCALVLNKLKDMRRRCVDDREYATAGQP